MSNLTRIKNNQITDSTIWANAKIVPGSIVGSLFSSNIVVTSDFVITGNLYVAGASTYLTVASTNTFVNDPLIVLNNAYSAGGIYDIGFIFERGTDDNQAFYWDETSDEFKLIATSEAGSTYGNIGAEISYSNFRLGNLFLNNYASTRALFMGSSGLVTTDADYTFDSTNNILKVGNFQFRGNTSTIATTGTNESIKLLPSGTGIIDASGFNLGNLAAPISGDDAVTLTYLNSQISSGVTNIQEDDTEVRITDDGVDAGQINANVDATSALVIKSNSISILGTGYTGSSPKVFIDGANSNVAIASKLFVTDVATLNSRAIISSTVPASSYTTGAVTVQGGVGIGGNLYVGAGIQDTVIGNVTPQSGFFTNLNSTGNVVANTITAYALGGIITTASQTNITAVGTLGSLNVTGNVLANTVTAYALGGIITTASQTNITAVGTLGSLNVTGNVSAAELNIGTVKATGLINTTGNVSAATVIAGQFNTTGNLVASQVSTGTLNATGLINTSGNLVASQVSTGSLNATGLINTSGNVIGATASFGAINSTGLINTSGNILGSAGTLSTLDLNSTTNATDATGTTGALQVSGGASIAKDLWVGGNIYAGNLFGVTVQQIAVQDPLLYLTASNLYPATYDIGFFSQFIGGTGNIYQHTGFVRDASDAYWKLFSNSVSEPTATITFDGTEIYDGLKIGNLVLTDTGTAISAAGFINTTANISGAVVNTGALNVTGTTTLAAINSTGFINTSGNVSAAVLNGGAINSTGLINTTGNISGAVINGGAINSTGLINTTGNVSAATLIAGQINTTGNVVASQVSTGTLNATGLINTTGNVSAAVLNSGAINSTGLINTTGNVSAATVIAGQFNTTGNLVAAEVSTGTLNATGFINTAGNVSAATVIAGQFNTTGNVLANTITAYALSGIITTASQTNITAVGTLGSLNVTGNVSAAELNIGTVKATGLINTTGNISGATVIAGQFNTTGNLVASQVSTGSLNATGLINTLGNISASRINADTLAATGTIWANSTTDTTSLTTGALIVAGGTAVGKTMWVGEGARINSTQSAESFHVLGQGTNNSLIYADFAKNAIVFGGANTAVQDGAVAKFNSTGAIVVPVGSNAERPGAAGNVDVAGMLRFNSTSNGLEFYDGTAWAAAGSEFTVITTNSFSGNGVQTVFTLSSAATTAGTLVMINGVVQIPTTAYSVTGTTLTFTEAPAAGDAIDARTLVTTATVSAISSGNGFNSFDVATAPYANVTAGTSAATVRMSIDGATGTATFTNDVVINGNLTVKGGSSGNINIGDQSTDKLQLQGSIVYNQTAINAPGTNLKELDSFSTAAYSTAKYLIQIKDGANIESAEVLLAHDTANVLTTTYAVLAPAGALGTFSSNIVSGAVKFWYTPSISTSANIKLQTTYIV